MSLEKIDLRAADGASSEVYLHGAHVTSWRPAPSYDEQLFLSAATELRDGVAIRGGIPVIFPQFAAEGPLPRHGFARTSIWTDAGIAHDPDGDAIATFTFSDSPATRAIWPVAFAATLAVRVGGRQLTVSLTVENTGTEAFSFTAALHTYLRVRDVALAEVIGLHGCRYRESVAPGVLRFDGEESLHLHGEIDRVYVGAPARLTLREPGRALAIQSSEFEDAVLWNPGAMAAGLKDMEPGGEKHMLCIEAATVQLPIVLDEGRRWSGAQTLTVL
ncbi:MAG: D-hexose-6-phosphate mutarotase [Gemmatimonadota bacterium]